MKLNNKMYVDDNDKLYVQNPVDDNLYAVYSSASDYENSTGFQGYTNSLPADLKEVEVKYTVVRFLYQKGIEYVQIEIYANEHKPKIYDKEKKN